MVYIYVKMQIALSRIWTYVTMPILYDDNQKFI